MQDASLVADLKCSGCGRPLVKDGCLKCTRCDALVVATLGENRIYCLNCSSPRVLLARNDEAMCPESKSRCENRRENKGTPMKLAVSEEKEVTQETVVASKTQELRDWLYGEIRAAIKDYLILAAANFPLYTSGEIILSSIESVVSIELINDMKIAPESFLREGGVRYSGLTSDEREAKMAEDLKKLEGLEKRLELLRSARELDVDVDALEKNGIPTRLMLGNDGPTISGHCANTFGEHGGIEDYGFTFRLESGKRKLRFELVDHSLASRVRGGQIEYNDIVKFETRGQRALSWRYLGKSCEYYVNASPKGIAQGVA